MDNIQIPQTAIQLKLPMNLPPVVVRLSRCPLFRQPGIKAIMNPIENRDGEKEEGKRVVFTKNEWELDRNSGIENLAGQILSYMTICEGCDDKVLHNPIMTKSTFEDGSSFTPPADFGNNGPRTFGGIALEEGVEIYDV